MDVKAYVSQGWQCLNVIPVFEILREERQEFNAILSYVRSFQKEIN